MARPNAVSAAIGTEKQFAKQQENIYQKRLIQPQFGRGISISADRDAEVLTRSLGVLATGIWGEAVAADRRKREQFTTEDADRMLAGKTAKDLEDYDIMMALQHSDKGFDLSDNPYAIATLEKGMGQLVSRQAKEQWHSQVERSQPPKSIDEAVQQYNDFLQQNYQNFQDTMNIRNEYAFNQGYYQGYQNDVVQVAHQAHQMINREYQRKGQQMMGVKFQDLANGAKDMDTATFTAAFGENLRELQAYCPDSKSAMAITNQAIMNLVMNETNTEKLNAIKDLPYFGDRKIGDEFQLFKAYQQIAKNFNKKAAADIYASCMRPDGTVDVAKAYAMVNGLSRTGAVVGGVTGGARFNLKVSPGDNPDLEHLSDSMKSALPLVGGVLANIGFGDIAMITSGARPGAITTSGNVSHHASGNAVDIWLGDNFDRTRGNQIAAMFKPYFKEAIFEKKGDPTGATNDHLHLGGYIGGLEGTGNNIDTQMTAAGYSPDRGSDIMNLIYGKNNEAVRIKKEQEKAETNRVLEELSGVSDLDKANSIVDNSSLPLTSKTKIKASFANQARRLAKGDLSPEQRYWVNYEKNGLFGDLRKMEEYNERVNDPDDEISDVEQKKYNRAARKINDYWDFAYGRGSQKQNTESPTPSPSAETQNTATQAATENAKDSLKGAVDKLKSMGKSDDEIQQMIERIAPEYGLDPVILINEWLGGGGEVD